MNKKIIEFYNLYKDKYKPWLVEVNEPLNIDDLAVIDDEVGGLVFLYGNGQDTPHLQKIIESLEKSILLSRKIEDNHLYEKVVTNLSIMLFICNLIKSERSV
jgi:hypothetical protein